MEIVKMIKFEGNAATHYFELRNPLKILFNSFWVYLLKVLPPSETKNSIYRVLLGVKIGKDVVISPDVILDPFFPELIEIGDDSILGWGSRLFTHEFHVHKVLIGRIKIGKQVLIGEFATLRAGINVGNGSVVQANSFADKNVPSNEVVGGVPIKPIKNKMGKRNSMLHYKNEDKERTNKSHI